LGVDAVRVSDVLDVRCEGVPEGECLRAARLLDEGLRGLLGVAGGRARFLGVVVKGYTVMVLSAFEVLRSYDGVAALDLSRPLHKSLFQALHSAAELLLRKRGLRGPRWLVEGLAGALALKALERVDPGLAGAARGELERIGCAGLDELLSWEWPVPQGGVQVYGLPPEEAARLVASLAASGLREDVVSHLKGGDLKLYAAATLTALDMLGRLGLEGVLRLEGGELEAEARRSYERACGGA